MTLVGNDETPAQSRHFVAKFQQTRGRDSDIVCMYMSQRVTPKLFWCIMCVSLQCSVTLEELLLAIVARLQ